MASPSSLPPTTTPTSQLSSNPMKVFVSPKSFSVFSVLSFSLSKGISVLLEIKMDGHMSENKISFLNPCLLGRPISPEASALRQKDGLHGLRKAPHPLHSTSGYPAPSLFRSQQKSDILEKIFSNLQPKLGS